MAMAVSGVLAAQDPPSRAGRVSYVSGTVSFEPAGISEWSAAQLNRPLTMGDQLYTDNGGRAEVEIPGTRFRLGSTTSFEFLNLDNQTAQVQLSAGTLDVRVRRMQGNLEIDTPNLAFTVSGPGEYRLDANTQSGQTLVTVRDGAGQMLAGSGSVPLHAGQQAAVQGAGQSAQYKINPVPGYDSFDRWVMSRNQLADRYANSSYVSPDVVGYGDMGQYGTWRSNPDYGEMWVPNGIAAGWAPYTDGYWAWVNPWGWTWVDAAPWGFAPFHYGRWAFVDGYWGWCPGPVAVEPVYAPALVAWVGFGAGFGVNIGFGGGPAVGWFALGPRDVWVPPFTASAAFVDRVNLGDTRFVNAGMVSGVYGGYLRTHTIPVASYMNRTAPGAVVAVPQKDFASARMVRQVALKAPPQAAANIRAADPAPRVAPESASLLGPKAGGPHPPAAIMNRPGVSRMKPPARPPSFAATQAAMARNPGHPISEGEMHEIARTAPAARAPAAAAPPHAVSPGAPPPAQHAHAQIPAPSQTAHTAPPRVASQPMQHAHAQPPAPHQTAHPTPPRVASQPMQHAHAQPPAPHQTAHPTPPRHVAPQPVQHAHAQPPPHLSAPSHPHAAAPPAHAQAPPHVEAPRPAPEHREPEHH
jgi:hypothetical protein